MSIHETLKGVTASEIPILPLGVRTTELSPIFQGTFEYTVDNTELTEEVLSGSGTVTQANAMAVISTGITPGSESCLMSHRLAKSRGGQGNLLRFTTIFSAPVAGTEQFIGMGDVNGTLESFDNGVVLGYPVSGVFGFHRFVNDTLVSINQADWDDPLDGSGPSGVVVDVDRLSKLNGWGLEQQGGAAAAKLFFEVTDGAFIPVHTIKYAGMNTEPSTYNPNYHFIVWASNGATTSDIIIKSDSYGFFVQGKAEPLFVQQLYHSTGRINRAGITAPTAIVTIRNKLIYAGKTNFIEFLLQLVLGSVESSSANNQAFISVYKNAVITGAVWSDINTTNSVVELDTTGTHSGGELLFGFPMAGKNANNQLSRSDFGDHVLLHAESLTIVGTSNNSGEFNVGMLWKELF